MWKADKKGSGQRTWNLHASCVATDDGAAAAILTCGGVEQQAAVKVVVHRHCKRQRKPHCSYFFTTGSHRPASKDANPTVLALAASGTCLHVSCGVLDDHGLVGERSRFVSDLHRRGQPGVGRCHDLEESNK